MIYFIDCDGIIFTIYSFDDDGIVLSGNCNAPLVYDEKRMTINELHLDDCQNIIIEHQYTAYKSLKELAEAVEGD